MKKPIERAQTGVRIEKRLLKVLKALAEYLDMTLGDLLEGIVLHNFDDKKPFSDETLSRHPGTLAGCPACYQRPPPTTVATCVDSSSKR
jgi:hypothetical protein